MKLSEVFYSIQGEGPHVGKPAIFIRLAGCNLSCEWCDSKFASRGTQQFDVSHDDILNVVAKYGNCKHIVWTGGEPLIQAADIAKTVREFKKAGYFQELETNGTIAPFPLNALIDSWNVSPKLHSSGGEPYKRVGEILAVWVTLVRNVTFKFAIKTDNDLREIELITSKFQIPPSQIMLMPVMTDRSPEMYQWVAEVCKKSGCRFSPRLQIDIYGDRRGV